MNRTLWEAHLLAENARLKLELQRVRVRLVAQRNRADLWRDRAQNAGLLTGKARRRSRQ